jgi:hypothetical protein
MSLGYSKGSCVALLQHRSQRGAGYTEFAVVASVLGILLTVFLLRVQDYHDEAERVVVKQVVSQLRTTLAVQAGALYLRGNRDELAVLAEQNPMRWLERAPANYLGEYDAPAASNIAPGHWYFDRERHTLSYVWSVREYFFAAPRKRSDFRVEFRRNEGKLTDSHSSPAAGGLSLEQIN